MARSTSDTSGYHSAPLHRHSSTNANRKRDFQQIDLGLSQSYSYSQTPWPLIGATTVARPPRVDGVQVYEPGEYCSKLANEAGALHFAAKKQRVDDFDESRPFAQSSTYASNMCVPSAHNVAPSLSMSTSMSTYLSSCSLAASESMSRQSSVSSASVTDAFDMMRVESSFSTASDLFPLDQLDGSFVSCVTEKPHSRQSTIGLNDGSASHLFSGLGDVGTDSISFYDPTFSAADGGQQNPGHAKDMHHASDDSSPTNLALELKASERRRKHIENSRQSIAPKRLLEVWTALCVSRNPQLTYRRAQRQSRDHVSDVLRTTRPTTHMPRNQRRPY